MTPETRAFADRSGGAWWCGAGRGARPLASLSALLLGLAAVAGAADIDVDAPALPPDAAPSIDGKPDPVWQKAPPVRFSLGEGSQGRVEVILRALRTDAHLYLLVEWPDKTESLNRFYEFSPSGWKPGRGREDRLNIGWSIEDSVKGFAAQGCQALCHKTQGTMRTGAPGERIDLWYWMAQRTNPVGVADNWVMTHEVAVVEGVKTGRRPDVSDGGPFAPNWSEGASRPRFGFKAGARPGPVLLKREAVELRATTRWKTGDRLPREVVEPPAGPRAAIEARGIWERGRWTVELRRALTTGNPDDVQFTGPGPFYFGVSIHDDADKDDHAQMGRDVLRLRLP